jgi:hypothetical protein
MGMSPDKARAYYLANRDKIRARRIERYWESPERARRETAEWREANRDRALATQARWYQEHREYALSRGRANRMKREYGITPDEYDARLQEQVMRCAICSQPFGDSLSPHVDHDHRTGVFRGVLCGSCNRAIGLMGDDPDRLLAASAYLLEAARGALRQRKEG